MSLKQSTTGVLVDSKGVVIVEVLYTLFQSRMFQTPVDGVGKEFNISIQRELVHGINTTHVVHYKE